MTLPNSTLKFLIETQRKTQPATATAVTATTATTVSWHLMPVLSHLIFIIVFWAKYIILTLKMRKLRKSSSKFYKALRYDVLLVTNHWSRVKGMWPSMLEIPLALTLISWVILSRWLNFSETQFYYL